MTSVRYAAKKKLRQIPSPLSFASLYMDPIHSFMPTDGHSFPIPTVYVTPPEEDSLLPYCCFDGSQPLDRDHLPSDNALELSRYPSYDSAPTFHRDNGSDDVVMPRKSMHAPSVADILPAEDDYDDYGQDITIRGNEPGDFSDVIEVVKVKRLSEREYRKPSTPISPAAPVAPPMKRSKTFISRAFRSIKNVNRSASHSKKSHIEDVFSPTESIQTVSSATSTSTATSIASGRGRRGSIHLAQIFTRSLSPKPRPSCESPTVTCPPSSSSLYTQFSAPDAQEQGQMYVDHHDSESIDARHDVRSLSPTPSMQTFSARKRFSVLNLFSSFNSSSSALPSQNASGMASSISIPMMSRDSLGPSSESSSSSSSSGPATPTTERGGVEYSLPKSSLLKRIPSFTKKAKGPPQQVGRAHMVQYTEDMLDDEGEDEDEPEMARDISFEMRLDSLHFEELTFDADRF